MANYVTNRLILGADKWTQIIDSCFENGQLDFGSLIPEPLRMYRGNISLDDKKDFPCNWYQWRIENWGTKWNAYNSAYQLYEGRLIILFDTAWSVPYPFITAFANAFKVPFEHAYFDEGSNFWGVEHWIFEDGTAHRSEARKSLDADYDRLRAELTGYVPE